MLNKGNSKQTRKTTYILGENIHKPCDRQGLNFHNTQTAHITQQPQQQKPNNKNKKTPNNPIKKMRRPRDFCPKERYRWLIGT